MHNLHFVVVKDISGKDACSQAESIVEGFGNENNWFSVCGAVSETNEVYKSGEGRYEPEDDHTIDMINRQVFGWIDRVQLESQIRSILPAGSNIMDLDYSSLCVLNSLIDELKQMSSLRQVRASKKERGEQIPATFDVLTEEYYDYEYDQCGVTHQINANDQNMEGVKWVVFIDMHS
jgi:hypothetical protein